MLTGQIIARPTGQMDSSGKRALVILYGIVAVPISSPLNAEGKQFCVSEKQNLLASQHLDLTVFLDGVTDRKEVTEGLTLSQVLMEPIWRT